ncbi:MAG: molybdopterin biosynthesis protein [Chloroflexi bacterium]|nr:molybdopterin biosynthesis protein [Chloroflexota bacterium]
MREHRHVYLEDVPLEEALRRFLSALQEAGSLTPTQGEMVAVEGSLGRVTAAPVWARISSPHYHAAAMDGVAIRSEDSIGASETSPVRIRIGDRAVWVDTGKPLPAGLNAVVMVENVQPVGEGLIEIMAPVAPWQHVRLMGEDIVASELMVPEGCVLRAADLGAIAQAGLTQLLVRRRPKVAIIPTGSELRSAGESLKPGDIVESNSLVLAGLVGEWGGVATRFAPVPDELDKLRDVLQEALAGHDIIVTNAGASAGRRDHIASLVAEMGRLVVHGVAIRPGHPVVLGILAGRIIVGTPGYPVSAALTADLFVKPLVYRLLGAAPPERVRAEAVLTRKVFSPMGEDEFLRVKLGRIGDKMVATPLQRGAGATMSLLRADGLVRIPRGSEGMHEGARVSVELLKGLEEIHSAIVVTGSHDLTLDLLANRLRRQFPQRNLSSSNVGSLGGLLALKRAEAHVAGSHLLDEESGEYNVPYVRRMLSGIGIIVINLVYREQGLIVAKGNPKAIGSLTDLLRPDVSFVNRQRGAGTRVLLDFKMRESGMDPGRVQGYDRVEFTHLAVALCVAAGTADAGLGIMAAARALNLDFVPLLKERYDLVMPRAFYDGTFLQPMLAVLQEPSFRSEVEGLGGYDASNMGQVVAEL